ncbi:MAG: cytochrome C, partial [bacterium]|nr:cytochrome C [bacterium]
MNAVFFKKTFFLSLFVLAFFISCHRFSPPASSVSIDRGRYLSVISGCHDCHTPGWAAAGGKAEEKIWLTGSDVGFEGPWGTTYPTNLRLNLQQMTEDQW